MSITAAIAGLLGGKALDGVSSVVDAVTEGAAGGIGGSLASALMDPKDKSGAMQSVVSGPNSDSTTKVPATDEAVPTTFGSAMQSAKEQILTGAASSASSAVLGSIEKLLGTTSRQGSEYRKALESAFPELNPWELAGSSAGGALGGTVTSGAENAQQRSEHANQQKALDKQLATQEKIAQDNNRTSERLGALQSATSIKNTEANNAASMATLDLTMNKMNEEIKNLRAGRGLTVQQTATEGKRTEQVGAQTKQIQEQTENVQHGDTPVGRGISTLQQLSDEAADQVEDKYNRAMETVGKVRKFFTDEGSYTDKLKGIAGIRDDRSSQGETLSSGRH